MSLFPPSHFNYMPYESLSYSDETSITLDPPSPTSTASSSAGQKRPRASKPKVRTGCITWIRRVKCDEAKPCCKRCTSTGRSCDGYDGPAPPRKPTGDKGDAKKKKKKSEPRSAPSSSSSSLVPSQECAPYPCQISPNLISTGSSSAFSMTGAPANREYDNGFTIGPPSYAHRRFPSTGQATNIGENWSGNTIRENPNFATPVFDSSIGATISSPSGSNPDSANEYWDMPPIPTTFVSSSYDTETTINNPAYQSPPSMTLSLSSSSTSASTSSSPGSSLNIVPTDNSQFTTAASADSALKFQQWQQQQQQQQQQYYLQDYQSNYNYTSKPPATTDMYQSTDHNHHHHQSLDWTGGWTLDAAAQPSQAASGSGLGLLTTTTHDGGYTWG